MSDPQRQKPTRAPVYRVCAGEGTGWHVFDGVSAEPVATFAEKSDALSYAMSLARGRAKPHMLLGTRCRQARSGPGVAHRAFSV